MKGTSANAEQAVAPPVGDDEEAVLLSVDRRFRRQFNTALFRLRVRGDITAADYQKYRAATFNTLKIEEGKAFIQRLREECEELAGDLLDDAVKWWEWLVEWVIENWATILKVVLSLLVFLETPPSK